MALTSCDLTNSSDWLLVGRKDGAVMLLDVRAGKWPKCFWKLHGQSIKTVHLHPTDNKYFATASRDGYVKEHNTLGHCVASQDNHLRT